MSRKFITKVIAGAAFGGASLLIAMPAMASAADDPHHDRDHKKVEGWVYAYPDHTKAERTVTLVQICKDPVQYPTIESDLLGVVELFPGTDPAKIVDHGKDKHGKKDGKHDKKADKNAGKHDKKFDKKDKKASKKDGKKHRVMAEELTDADAALEAELDAALEAELDAALEDEMQADLTDGKVHKKDGKKGKKDHKGKEPKGKKDHKGKEDHKGKKHDDHPWAYFAEVQIPAYAEPGKYELKGDCGKGDLIVVPSGWVDGGDGGFGGATTDTTSVGLLAGGAGMLAAAAIGGTALIRRRTTDGSLA